MARPIGKSAFVVNSGVCVTLSVRLPNQCSYISTTLNSNTEHYRSITEVLRIFRVMVSGLVPGSFASASMTQTATQPPLSSRRFADWGVLEPTLTSLRWWCLWNIYAIGPAGICTMSYDFKARGSPWELSGARESEPRALQGLPYMTRLSLSPATRSRHELLIKDVLWYLVVYIQYVIV